MILPIGSIGPTGPIVSLHHKSFRLRALYSAFVLGHISSEVGMDKKGGDPGGLMEDTQPRPIQLDGYPEISLDGGIIQMESQVTIYPRFWPIKTEQDPTSRKLYLQLSARHIPRVLVPPFFRLSHT
jgi:hypothetical protein